MKRLLFLLSALCCGTGGSAQTADTDAAWATQLRQRLAPLVREADSAPYHTGICVYDLTADSLLFGYNQQKVMRPASTQKVLTAVSALLLLGKNHTYRTRAYTDGPVTTDTLRLAVASGTPDSMTVDTQTVYRRTLQGNLYVRGGFDPAFSLADLRDIALSVRRQGIDSIAGRIVADVSMTDTARLGNGWCWDDVPSEGIPYLSPLLVNGGKPVEGRGKKCLPNPERHFVETLAWEIRQQGVGVRPFCTDVTSHDPRTPECTDIYTRTRTVEQMLPQMMKESDNLYAESMFYLLAAQERRQNATWKDGARQVERMLARAGAGTSDAKVADGSGVSLYNYVSPQVEVSVLRLAYRDGGAFPALYHAMPIAGIDGTLERRMPAGPAHNNVRAKTGTVTGVSCLAGYVRASNGHLLAFSIMNNGVLKSATGRDFQDRVCQELAR